MLIVAKNHDYYDTAHDGYVDKSIVYQRVPKQITDYLKERYSKMSTVKNDKRIDINFPYVGGETKTRKFIENKNLFLVGFCGKFYVGLHYTKYEYIGNQTTIDRYIYKLDEIIECLGLKPDKKITTRGYYFGNYYNSLVDFYNKYNGVERFELFLEYKTPIIYIGNDRKVLLDPDCSGDRRIVLNPILKDIEFFKTGIDAKTAFDSISIFISNILTNVEKEVIVSDKVKIESHGFDYKISFRKEKGE